MLSEGVQLVYVKGLLRYFAYFSFALYAATLSKRVILLLFKAIILFFIFSLPLAIYQINVIGRYQNIFAHANHFSYVLMICIYFIIKHKVFSKSIRPMIIFIMLVSLLLASSTGAILTLLGLLIYHYFSITKRNFFKFAFSFLVLASVIIAISFTEKISAQIGSLQYLDIDFIQEKAKYYSPGGHGSFVWRLVYWLQILQNFLENSSVVLFFGEGIDTLTKDNYLYSFMYTDPHNDYLKVLVEFGIFGLLFLFAFLARIYNILKKFDILIMLTIPLFFANIIVSWPFNIVILLYLMYELHVMIGAEKKVFDKQSEQVKVQNKI
jgi:O-antigen ligase